jgi:ferritin-like metal-binding protein YciE
MSKVESFEDLFRHELSDMYSAEKQLAKALSKMAKAATDDTLREAFETHREETQEQIEKLEKVFESCDIKPERITCEAMKGLIKESEEAVDDIEEGPLLDCALIIAAQKVEHYEIAGYGALCELARKMGADEAEQVLSDILEQEKMTDEKLTECSRSINAEAAGEDMDDDEDSEDDDMEDDESDELGEDISEDDEENSRQNAA